MSGHNKWSKIKHKKADSDAKKSKEFSKIASLIAAEARRMKGDMTAPTLRVLIEKARSINMPKENIERAVAKGRDDLNAVYESVTYEAYGPGGVALIIEGVTENKNRVAAELKKVFSKHQVALAAPGSATWAFTKGEDGWTPNTTMDLADADLATLEALANEIEEIDGVNDVYTNAE
jgi:YebC/PmpR family DNA-binding regulatory protein